MNVRENLPIVCCAIALILMARANADEPPQDPAAAARSLAPAGPVPAAVKHDVVTGQTSGGPGEPAYGISASWVIAGYNDNEVIYSIIITNDDANVIRCTTLLSGFYLDSGTRHAVSDRQSVTLFPGKQSSAGTWVGLDQASGATYKITCRAVH
jgi:hypothetical protein